MEEAMRKLVSTLAGLSIATAPGLALAEGATAYSRGNAFLYFSVIAAVLIFGIHDVFHKKWLTIASAIVIPVLFYLGLPEK
jgi:hypothetical protein